MQNLRRKYRVELYADAEHFSLMQLILKIFMLYSIQSIRFTWFIIYQDK